MSPMACCPARGGADHQFETQVHGDHRHDRREDAVAATPNIRIIPTAPVFAQAILNIWNGTSVSSLFETPTLEPIYEGHFG
jgi:hypothetical protein